MKSAITINTHETVLKPENDRDIEILNELGFIPMDENDKFGDYHLVFDDELTSAEQPE